MRNFKRKLSLLLSLAMIFSLLTVGFAAHADGEEIVQAQGNEVSSWAVTTLTVDKDNITDGQTIKVHLEFAGNQPDSPQKIKEGDTITVSWDRQGNSYLSGYHETLKLEHKGHHIAQAVITDTSAVITFNKNVNNLQNVTGYLNFNVRGRNVAEEEGLHEDTIILHTGDKEASVTISRDNTDRGDTDQDSDLFYYKTGASSLTTPNTIEWGLCINVNKRQVVNSITVQDDIQDGHELIPESFSISVNNPNQYVPPFKAPNAIQEFQKAYPDASIAITGLHHFTVTVPEECASGSFVWIQYSTKLVNKTQKEFFNKSNITYQEAGKKPVNEPYDLSVEAIYSDAGIEGTVPGEFRLHKIISDTEVPVVGAEFKLWRQDGAEVFPGKKEITLKTNDDGIADIKELDIGTYYVQEIGAPNYVAFKPLEATVMDFKIEPGASSGVERDVENEPSPDTGFLTVSKKVSGTGADTNQAFTFTVTLGSNKINTTFGEMTFQNGVATFSLKDGQSKTAKGLPVGLEYTVTEQEAEGYTTTVNGNAGATATGLLAVNPTKVEFQNRKDGVPPVEPPAPAVVTLTAEKKLDGNAPSGSAFTFLLTKEDGTVVQTKNNVDGTVTFDELRFEEELQVGEKVTHTYLIKEQPGTNDKITYDPSEYKVIITVTRPEDQNAYVASVSYLKDGEAYADTTPIFRNTTKELTSVSVTKVWDHPDQQNPPASATVQLFRNGVAHGDPVTLHEENQWKHTWTDLEKDAV